MSRSQKHYSEAIAVAQRLGLVNIEIEHGATHPRVVASTVDGKPIHAGFPSSPGATNWTFGLHKRLQRSIRQATDVVHHGRTLRHVRAGGLLHP